MDQIDQTRSYPARAFVVIFVSPAAASFVRTNQSRVTFSTRSCYDRYILAAAASISLFLVLIPISNNAIDPVCARSISCSQ